MAQRCGVDLKITRLLLQIGVMCARLNQFADAEQIIRAVLAFRDDLPHPRTALAMSYLCQGRLHEAAQELEAGLAAFPQHQLGKAFLGLVYREAGRPEWRGILQEVIEDGRDEWAIELAQHTLGGSEVSATSVAQGASTESRPVIPHAQRVYA
jgi:predicted Zn-dependent protease